MSGAFLDKLSDPNLGIETESQPNPEVKPAAVIGNNPYYLASLSQGGIFLNVSTINLMSSSYFQGNECLINRRTIALPNPSRSAETLATFEQLGKTKLSYRFEDGGIGYACRMEVDGQWTAVQLINRYNEIECFEQVWSQQDFQTKEACLEFAGNHPNLGRRLPDPLVSQ